MDHEKHLETLYHAIEASNLDAVREVIARNDGTIVNPTVAEINRSEMRERPPPLVWACSLGSMDIIRFLLAEGANVNAVVERPGGMGALAMAVMCQRLDVMELLLDCGAIVDIYGADGNTPLRDAMMAGFKAGIKLLVEFGAKLQPFNIRKPIPPEIQLLLDAKPPRRLPRRARPDSASPERLGRFLALIKAGNTRAMVTMIENGEVCINPTIAEQQQIVMTGEDSTEATLPLMAAISHAGAFRILIEYGADMNLPNKNEMTPLMGFCTNGQEEDVENLLERGANPNYQDSNGFTALMVASMQGRLDLMMVLLDFGADRTLRTFEKRKTAAEMVRDFARLEREHKGATLHLLKTFDITPRVPTKTREFAWRQRARPQPSQPSTPRSAPAPSAAAKPVPETKAAASKATPAAPAAQPTAPPPVVDEVTAEAKRSQGNDAFKRGAYKKAIELYTEAGDAKSLANRAQCYNKLEQYNLCVRDCAALVKDGGSESGLPSEVLDKVYNRLGVALFELAQRGYLIRVDGIPRERQNVNAAERARQLDLYRTAAYYIALSNAQADTVMTETRCLCYRRLATHDAWSTEQVSEPLEGLPLVSSLSVCMLCWKENDSTRLVRSNLVPNPILNLFHCPHSEPLPLYPIPDTEGVSACVGSLRFTAPHYRRYMFCDGCDTWLEAAGCKGFTKFLRDVHNPEYEGVFQIHQPEGNIALMRTLLVAGLIARHDPQLPGAETRSSPHEGEWGLAETTHTARKSLVEARQNYEAGQPFALQLPATMRLFIDEDSPSDWPVRRRWFGVNHFTSQYEDNRARPVSGYNLWIQLGLVHLVLGPNLRCVDMNTFGELDRSISFGTRREIATRNAQNGSFVRLMHARMLRGSWHPYLDRMAVAIALERYRMRPDGPQHYTTGAPSINGRVMMTSIISWAKSNRDFKPCPEIFLPNYHGFSRARGLGMRIQPYGKDGTFPPTGSRAVVAIYDDAEALPGHPMEDAAFGDRLHCAFAVEFTARGKFKGIVEGDNGPFDEFIVTAWLHTDEILEAIAELWQRAKYITRGG